MDHDCACTHHHRRRRINWPAVLIAALAVVLASTGTAVAVAVTQTQITDPTTPANIAKVDQYGRLSSGLPLSTIASSGSLQTQYQNNIVVSATRATIGITRIGFTNPKQNANNTTSEYEVFLRRINADSTGACNGAITTLAIYTVEPGDDIEDSLPSPISVGPMSGSPMYCVSLYVIPTNSDGTIHYFTYYAFAAYVVSGQYRGTGANAPDMAPATSPDKPTSR